MNDIILLISAILIGTAIILIAKHKRKIKKQSKKRTPFRMDHVYTSNRHSNVTHRKPETMQTYGRMPRRAEDKEYLTFRNCPDCHSENEPGKQVIFKIAAHDFVCTNCKCKFKF